jgi:hypothetical protein
MQEGVFGSRWFTDLVPRSALYGRKASTTVWDSSRDFALVVELLFAAFMKATSCVHQELDTAISKDAGANGRIIVTTAGANVVLGRHEQFGHWLCS